MESLEQSGSQGWPLGEGGSDLGPHVEGAQHEACVRKGAPKRLSGRLARAGQEGGGWSQAGRREGARGRWEQEVRPPPGAASGQQGELGTRLILALPGPPGHLGPGLPLWPPRQSR